MQTEQTIAHGVDGWDLVEVDVDFHTGDERMTYEKADRGAVQAHERIRPRSMRIEREAYEATGAARLEKIRDGLFGYFAQGDAPRLMN